MTPAPGPVTVIVTGSGVPSQRDDGGLAERRPRRGGDAVGGDPALADPGVVAADGLDGDARRPRSTSTAAVPSNAAVPSCSPRSRRSGVNRQFSSRPPGTSKASTS